MRGLIMLDGPDGAGKTTLANALHNKIVEKGGRAGIKHLGLAPAGTAWEVQSQALLDYIDTAFRENCVVIADRHFMSEAIYAKTYRSGSEYAIGVRHMDRLMHRFRALRVICAPPAAFVVEHHKKLKMERQEDYDDGMDKVANRYLSLWHGAGPNNTLPGKDYLEQLTNLGGVKDRLGWFHYDLEAQGASMDKVISYLLWHLEIEQDLLPDECYDIAGYRFTGFPHKRAVLIVGDRTTTQNSLNIPYYTNEGVDFHLAESLHKIHADESRIVLANICDSYGITTVGHLAQLCGKVVAMGREAERAMLLQGVNYDAVIRSPYSCLQYKAFDPRFVDDLGRALDGWAAVKY